MCYNDKCQIYKFKKDGTNWYPRLLKKKILNIIKYQK